MKKKKKRIEDVLTVTSGPRDAEGYVDAEELGLEPLAPVDLSQVNSFADLLRAMKQTAFGGRRLGEAADVLYEMVSDPRCLVVGTFSGAMTVAKQGMILCDMIDEGMLDIVVSTGALMTHGLVEAAGMTHFKVPPHATDRQMFYAGFDRVYDTLELEQNLDDLGQVLDTLLTEWPADQTVSSAELLRVMGHWLDEHVDGRAILSSAARRGVPVYVPAFSDSELGLDYAIHNRRRAATGRPRLAFDPFIDLEDYTERIAAADRVGIFTIGGGVPRNWAQQVAPYIDFIAATFTDQPGELRRFRYAVRICPEPVHFGGLSGCTYSEGVSWGKFLPPSEGGRFAEVQADATIAWPMLIAGVLERLRADRAATGRG
jgi:deoxyhypusine synthase